MRVLFDYQAFSIQPRGGISRYVLALARELASAGVETRVEAGWHRSELLRFPLPGVTGRFVRHFPRTGPLRHAWNRHRMRRVAANWRPNLIHETYFRRGESYRPGVPVVLTVYDLTYFVFPDAQREAAAVRRAQIAAVHRADHVICISQNTRADLLRFIPIDPARVSVVPLAGPPPGEETVRGPAPLDRPYFLHVGLRNSYKNFDALGAAFAQSTACRSGACVVAFGGGDLTAAERAAWRRHGLPDHQLLHRAGDDAVLARYYAHAVACVCPSLYEGFGLPVLEAMTHGCVILCSDRGSLPEVAGEAALYFDPTAPETLAAALDQVFAPSPFTAALRERGRHRAAGFSWSRCGRETLAIYRRLLA